tara:strand:- start:446 stop:721 length:276 start_codon:yes stop_codon:yes gene_type:complete
MAPQCPFINNIPNVPDSIDIYRAFYNLQNLGINNIKVYDKNNILLGTTSGTTAFARDGGTRPGSVHINTVNNTNLWLQDKCYIYLNKIYLI